MHLPFKAIKIQGKLLKIVQAFLLISILTVLYWQLSKFNWSSYEWTAPGNTLALVTAGLLVFANWFFEWLKWTRIASRVGLNDSETIKRGFYAGMVSGFLTPSALGNFIGRMTEVNSELKPKVVSHTFFANGAQFIVSLFFGLLSLFIFFDQPIVFATKGVFYLVLGSTLFAIALYFLIQKVLYFKNWLKKKAPSISNVRFQDKLQYLLFSTFRYLVFSFQFYLVIKAFQPEVSITTWFWIWNLYLWTTLSPSLLMGKLLIRESLAVFVLTKVGVELPVALLASLLIWAMNNALPSIYAYFKWRKYVLVKA